MEIVRAGSSEHFEMVRLLFTEYASTLSFDLCFQDFEHELVVLPGDYAPPGGSLLLAFEEGEPVGCVAVRKLEGSTCEMKRLYVRPASRGKGIGRRLAEEIVRVAGELGYRSMRLDTIPGMVEAISLYRSIGFTEVDPYRHNPIEGALFMSLEL
jgi:putative acetyltransferase